MSYRVASIIALVGVVLSSAALATTGADRADALTGDAVVTLATVDPKTGVLLIEGRLNCFEEPGELVIIDPIVVSQRQGDRIVSAYDETGVLCGTDGPSTIFHVRMGAYDPETGERLRFHPGMAAVSGTAFVSGMSTSPGGSASFGPIPVRLEPSRLD